MSLNNTPRANILHVGIFGRRNAGKSSLINALTGQTLAIVSDTPGTTADPVYKSMELHPIGPVVFIDTAGFDDEGELGQPRVAKTTDVIARTDVAILVLDGSSAEAAADRSFDVQWFERLEKAGIPVITVVNKTDAPDCSVDQLRGDESDAFARTFTHVLQLTIVAVLPVDGVSEPSL